MTKKKRRYCAAADIPENENERPLHHARQLLSQKGRSVVDERGVWRRVKHAVWSLVGDGVCACCPKLLPLRLPQQRAAPATAQHHEGAQRGYCKERSGIRTPSLMPRTVPSSVPLHPDPTANNHLFSAHATTLSAPTSRRLSRRQCALTCYTFLQHLLRRIATIKPAIAAQTPFPEQCRQMGLLHARHQGIMLFLCLRSQRKRR